MPHPFGSSVGTSPRDQHLGFATGLHLMGWAVVLVVCILDTVCLLVYWGVDNFPSGANCSGLNSGTDQQSDRYTLDSLLRNHGVVYIITRSARRIGKGSGGKQQRCILDLNPAPLTTVNYLCARGMRSYESRVFCLGYCTSACH